MQVLIYSGQLDVIVAAPLTERFLPTVNWSRAAEFRKAPRFPWKVQPNDTEVAGYVRQVGEFFQVFRTVYCPLNITHKETLCLDSHRSLFVEGDTFCPMTNLCAPLI